MASSHTTTVTVTLAVEVDDHTWADHYGEGDAYDEAEAQRPRSLVADVQDYVLNMVQQSAAAQEGAIIDAELFIAPKPGRTS